MKKITIKLTMAQAEAVACELIEPSWTTSSDLDAGRAAITDAVNKAHYGTDDLARLAKRR